MNIEINGKECELSFGLRFVREMDKKNFIEQGTVKFGTSLEYKIPFIVDRDPTVLAEVLYSAGVTAKKRPTQDEIDDYIDTVADIDALFMEVIDELKKGNATKLRMARLEEQLGRTVGSEATTEIPRKPMKK